MTEEKNQTNTKEAKPTGGRKFTGVVTSDKMDKTVVVRVDSVKLDQKYKKRYAVSQKFKAHDEKNKFKEGDKIIIQECRPISKDKRWRVVY